MGVSQRDMKCMVPCIRSVYIYTIVSLLDSEPLLNVVLLLGIHYIALPTQSLSRIEKDAHRSLW
jgi:hypothetical protein